MQIFYYFYYIIQIMGKKINYRAIGNPEIKLGIHDDIMTSKS